MKPIPNVNENIDQNYRLKRKLREDRSSVRFLAENIRERKDVVLQFLNPGTTSSSIEDFIRFKREIEIINKLHHPNITPIKILGQYNNAIYLETEIQDGRLLSEFLEGSAKLKIDDSVEITKQLAEIFIYVHSHGIVHRDLRTGNVMLIPDGDDLHIKLLDFGLAIIMELSGIKEKDEIVSAFGYMSPEATGIVKRRIDERSDLYSLGAIFYHLLTGEQPFKATDINALLHQQIAVESPTPRSIRPEISPILEEIALKLLCKDPELRYQSAGGLFYDLQRYQNGEREFIICERDQKTKLNYQTKLVGREKELQKIIRLLQEAESGRGSICLIGGEAGVGKTRLVEEVRAYACEREILFLEGCCFSQENKMPYRPFRDIINGCIRSVQRLSNADREEAIGKIKEVLGDSGEVIIRLNPRIEELLGEMPELVPLDPERERQRFLMVASRFFNHIGERSRVAVLFLDDLQWADEGTLALLEEIAAEIEMANLLILGTYRDHEVGKDHSLNRIKESVKQKGYRLQDLSLKSFDQARCTKLVAGILGEKEDRAERLARYVLEKSGGNPFFAITLLRELVEQKVIAWNEGYWEEDWERIKAVQVPTNVLDMILLRTRDLSKELDRVLRIASVIGSSFEMELLYQMLGDIEEQIMDLVDEAVEKQLMQWSVTEKGKLLFIHDRVKQAFYEEIGDNERKAFHLQVAEAIERKYGGKEEEWIFDLAGHYAEGGNRDKTLKYAIPAAEKAKGNYANKEAARYYRTAIEILEARDGIGTEEWVRIKEGLADVSLLMGNSDEAISLCRQILPYKRTPLERARVYRNIGVAHFKKAEWKLCEETMAKGLSLLGDNLPGTRKSVLSSLLKEMAAHMLHSAFPILFLRREKKTSRTRDEAVELVHLYMRLNWSYILSDNLKFIRSVLRTLNVSETRIGKSRELAQGLAGYAGAMMSIPFFNSSLRVQKKAIALRKELKDEWGLAQSLFFSGYCYLWSGDYQKGIELLRQAGKEFERMGDMWELAVTNHALGDACRYLGDYEKSISFYSKRTKISERIGDAYGACGGRSILSYCYIEKGDFPKAEELARNAMALSKEKEIWFIYCTSHARLGYLEFERENFSAAIEHLEEARTIDGQHSFIKEYTGYLYSQLADAYMGRFGQLSAGLDTQEGKNELERIGNACETALKESRKWPNHYGAALRTKAKYYALTGRADKAREYFQRSINETESLGRKYEAGRSYYEYGNFLHAAGQASEAGAKWERAYQVFKEIGAQAYIKRCSDLLGYRGTEEHVEQTTPQERLQLARRMAAVLNTSRYLSSILDLDELLEKIMDKTMELVGAGRGALFLFPEEPQGVRQKLQGEGQRAKGEGEQLSIINRHSSSPSQSSAINHQSSIPNQSAIRHASGRSAGADNPQSAIFLEPRVVRDVKDQDLGSFRVNHRIFSRVLEEKKPFILEDASVQISRSGRESVSASGSKSVLCAPLISKGNLLGVIYLDNHLVSGLFNENDLEILELISSQAAVSLENARLYNNVIKNEKALKESEEKYRLISENASDLIAVTTLEGICTYVSPSHRQYGYEPKELLGRSGLDLLHPDDRESLRGLMAQYAEKKSKNPDGDSAQVAKQIEFRLPKKSGEWLHFGSTLNLVFDDSGAPAAFLLVSRDITRQKQAEEEAKLRQEQLFQAAKMASLGTLVSGVAHEINNPMSYIMLNAPILQKTWDDVEPILREHRAEKGDFRIVNMNCEQLCEEIPALLGDIIDGTKRVKTIINDLKEFARQAPPEFDDNIDVNAVAERAVNLVSNLIKKSTERFSVFYEPDIPSFRGNAQRIEQVIINLVVNACQALSNRQQAVTVTTGYSAGTDTIYVEVRDEGTGIPPHLVERIKDPFFTTKREAGGTGLGLAISDRIIQDHGGTMEFESTPGKGTTVRVAFKRSA